MSPTRYWTEELVFEALRTWEREHRRLPSSKEWTKSPGDRKLRPTARTVEKLFGGWTRALVAYEEYRGLHRKRWKIWTEEEIIEALQEWAAEHGGYPPTHKILTHGAEGGRLPSMTSVTGRFGSFRAAVKAAGLQPLPRGVTYKSLRKFRPLPRKGKRS